MHSMATGEVVSSVVARNALDQAIDARYEWTALRLRAETRTKHAATVADSNFWGRGESKVIWSFHDGKMAATQEITASSSRRQHATRRVDQVVCTSDWYVQREHKGPQSDVVFAYADEHDAKDFFSHGYTGMFVFGYLPDDLRNVFDLVDRNRAFTVSRESLHGESILLFSQKTSFGSLSIWFSESQGMRPRRVELVKSTGDLINERTLPVPYPNDESLVGATYVLENLQYKSIDGRMWPVSGRMVERKISSLKSGSRETISAYDTAWSGHELTPKFKEREFTLHEVGDGTPVLVMDQPGLAYQMIAGLPRLNTADSTAAAVDQATVALKAELARRAALKGNATSSLNMTTVLWVAGVICLILVMVLQLLRRSSTFRNRQART
jgi:hypothetical protein